MMLLALAAEAVDDDVLPSAPSWRVDRVFRLTSWRTHAARALSEAQGLDLSGMDIYEFGVYTGGSLENMASAWTHFKLPVRAVHGFDSFVGLNDEAEEVRGINDKGRAWQRGAFSASAAFKSASYSEVTKKIVAYVGRRSAHKWFADKVDFVRGFFNESLTAELATSMKPAMYIDIDTDLYIGAKQALAWMFENKLVVPGTFIGYDDWSNTPLWTAGESRAHAEVAREFNVRFELVHFDCSKHAPPRAACPMCANCSSGLNRCIQGHPVFRVVSIGAEAPQYC